MAGLARGRAQGRGAAGASAGENMSPGDIVPSSPVTG